MIQKMFLRHSVVLSHEMSYLINKDLPTFLIINQKLPIFISTILHLFIPFSIRIMRA